MTVSAANVATAVTLSAVSIIYDTSGTEVELAAANYSYSNGVITLNLTSGSGRVTLDNLSDGVTISTTWSNGDVATDTSNVLAVVVPITITAPESFISNQNGITITAANVPDGVTLTAITVNNVALTSDNYSVTGNTITVNLGYAYGSNRAYIASTSGTVTISTTWSNEEVATDTSSMVAGIYDRIGTIQRVCPDTSDTLTLSIGNVPSDMVAPSMTVYYNDTSSSAGLEGDWSVVDNAVTADVGYTRPSSVNVDTPCVFVFTFNNNTVLGIPAVFIPE